VIVDRVVGNGPVVIGSSMIIRLRETGLATEHYNVSVNELAEASVRR